jgi:hypothetical protein
MSSTPSLKSKSSHGSSNGHNPVNNETNAIDNAFLVENNLTINDILMEYDRDSKFYKDSIYECLKKIENLQKSKHFNNF